MDEMPRSCIGHFGRYLIFSGSGMALIALCMLMLKPLERVSGEAALPYLILALVITCVLATSLLFERCPKRLVLPIGFFGWFVAFLMLLLRNWL